MSRFRFIERAPHEQGFAAVFEREVVPILERQEEARAAALGRRDHWRGKVLKYGLPVVLVLAALSAWAFLSGWIVAGAITAFFAVFSVMAAGMVYFVIGRYHEKMWSQGMATEVLPIVCDFLGDVAYGDANIRPGTFRELGIVPSFSIDRVYDPVSGTHGGLRFDLAEVVLQRKTSGSNNQTRYVTAFRGLLMTIALEAPAPTIIFTRDRGGVGNWLKDTFSAGKHTRIEIDDPEFEAAYETFAEDPDAARAYITTGLTRGLLAVAQDEAQRDVVAAALKDRTLYLAIPRKEDFLNVGKLNAPMDTEGEIFHRFLSDLTLPRRVIDALRGARG